MSERLKRALIWGVIGFIASFLMWQGVDDLIMQGESFRQIIKIAYGTPKYLIRGPITAIGFFALRYCTYKEK